MINHEISKFSAYATLFSRYVVPIIFTDLFTVVQWLADRGHAWMVLNQIGGATIATMTNGYKNGDFEA